MKRCGGGAEEEEGGGVTKMSENGDLLFTLLHIGALQTERDRVTARQTASKPGSQAL